MRHAPQPHVQAHLDPQSKQSKYRQIREILKTHAREACKPGYKLPPERVLAEHFGVARKTIRQAIDALVELGARSPPTGTAPAKMPLSSLFVSLQTPFCETSWSFH